MSSEKSWWFQNLKCPEFKSNIGNIFVNEKILKEYSVKIDKIDPYFYEHYGKKIQVDENGCKYILFRTDIYFIEYLLAVEINEKGHTDRDLIFEEKRQKALEKKLGRKFIKINTSKEGYNADYEASKVQTFISEFKNEKLKKLEELNQKNKRTRRRNKKKLKLELASKITQ